MRRGIAIYGLAPSPEVEALVPEPGLRAAMSLRSVVSFVKVVAAGDGVSYGLRHTFDTDTVVATVPLGYADGVARNLGLAGGDVLIGGRRRPIVGVVTMDQLMVACDDSARGRRRGRADRRPGRRAHHRDRVGGPPRHDQLRDRVRHQRPSAPAIPRGLGGGHARGRSVITDIPGVRVGHWTHPEAQTGCTVILFPEGTRASGEVRGGAPATREFDLLAPERMVDRLDAVLLTGGSAFGLASADGVMRWCAEQGSGFATGAGPVPIVVTMALFDLLVGEPHVRPGAVEGYAACAEARGGAVQVGRIGAGTGATIGKWRGREHARPGGSAARPCATATSS